MYIQYACYEFNPDYLNQILLQLKKERPGLTSVLNNLS